MGGVCVSKCRRTMAGYTHRNQNQTVRDNQLVGNIRVNARRYNTGREDVSIHSLVPNNAEQATQLGF